MTTSPAVPTPESAADAAERATLGGQMQSLVERLTDEDCVQLVESAMRLRGGKPAESLRGGTVTPGGQGTPGGQETPGGTPGGVFEKTRSPALQLLCAHVEAGGPRALLNVFWAAGFGQAWQGWGGLHHGGFGLGGVEVGEGGYVGLGGGADDAAAAGSTAATTGTLAEVSTQRVVLRGLIFVASLEGGSDVFRDPALQETIFGLAFGADREAKALSLQLLLKLVQMGDAAAAFLRSAEAMLGICLLVEVNLGPRAAGGHHVSCSLGGSLRRRRRASSASSAARDALAFERDPLMLRTALALLESLVSVAATTESGLCVAVPGGGFFSERLSRTLQAVESAVEAHQDASKERALVAAIRIRARGGGVGGVGGGVGGGAGGAPPHSMLPAPLPLGLGRVEPSSQKGRASSPFRVLRSPIGSGRRGGLVRGGAS